MLEMIQCKAPQHRLAPGPWGRPTIGPSWSLWILILPLWIGVLALSAGPVRAEDLDAARAECATDCTPVIQIENFTPGSSVYSMPLDDERDYAALQAFLKKAVPAKVALDISILVPGQGELPKITPLNAPAKQTFREFVSDTNGQELAAKLGLREPAEADHRPDLYAIAEGISEGFGAESAIQQVEIPSNLVVDQFEHSLGSTPEELGSPSTTAGSSGFNLLDENDGTPGIQDQPGSRSFWQRLRGDGGSSRSRVTASIVLGTTVGVVNSATVMINSGISLPQAMIVAGAMGAVTGSLNFWSVHLARWYGNGRFVLEREGGTPGKFGRFVRMNSKRALVGWTLGMVFRMTFRAAGIMSGGSFGGDVVAITENTIYSVANGYPWSKVTSNLARNEGTPLPGRLRRIVDASTLSLVLTIAYQASSVLYHVPGHENVGRVVVGIISAAGIPVWIYQSIDVKKVVRETASRLSNLGNRIWCEIILAGFNLNTAY